MSSPFSLNRFQAQGNLTRDAEGKYIGQDGNYVLEFSVAINQQKKQGDKWVDDEPLFMDFAFWGKAAEKLAPHMTKGTTVFAEGRLKLDRWDDKETGEKRSKMRCTAERVIPQVNTRGSSEGSTSKPAGKPAQKAAAKSATAGLEDESGF